MSNIITLSGSSRFIGVMAATAFELEKRGNIVLSCHLLPHWYTAPDGSEVKPHHQAEAEGVTEALDQVQADKIAMSDLLYVINIEGYIGESTRREIEYAKKIGTPVVYLLEEVLRGRAPWMERVPYEATKGLPVGWSAYERLQMMRSNLQRLPAGNVLGRLVDQPGGTREWIPLTRSEYILLYLMAAEAAEDECSDARREMLEENLDLLWNLADKPTNRELADFAFEHRVLGLWRTWERHRALADKGKESPQ